MRDSILSVAVALASERNTEEIINRFPFISISRSRTRASPSCVQTVSRKRVSAAPLSNFLTTALSGL